VVAKMVPAAIGRLLSQSQRSRLDLPQVGAP
jgi:hypothetical protein